MTRGREIQNDYDNTSENKHRLTQTVLTGLVTLGIIDDLTIVGIADNGFVAAGAAVLTAVALRSTVTENDSTMRNLVKTGLAGAITGMMVDDGSFIGIVDNPIAFACAATLGAMNYNDWRKNRA